MQKGEPLKAALYARYSSEIQRDGSIEDQWRELEIVAKRFNLELNPKHYYCDRAISGTEALESRPGLSVQLLAAAERGEFSAVLVEATDRLSRDESDTHWLKKVFAFCNIKVFTRNGEVSDLQWTFDGYGNEDFIKKLRVRVKRGHDAAARDGRVTTCAAYGYDIRYDPANPTKRGLRQINEGEAAVLHRVFAEYAGGVTPRQIAAGLERDGIPSPSGKAHWNHHSIVGGKGAKRGLLHNRLYIGEIVRNRFTAPKNPITKRRQIRALPTDELITVQVPELRIISDELWNAAHAMREKRQHEKFPGGYVKRATISRRQDLLSGLIVCASCGGQMTTVASSCRGGRRVSCSNATQRRTCEHSKSYNVAQLTAGAIKHVHEELTDPEFLKEKAKAKAQEAARLAKEQNEERRKLETELAKLDVGIKRMAAMAFDSDTPEEIMEVITAKNVERAAKRERLKHLGEISNVVPLDTVNLSQFSQSVDVLHDRLLLDPNDAEARAAFHNIVEKVAVYPTAKGGGYVIAIYARVSAVLGGIELFPKKNTAKEIVEAEGLRRFGTGGDASSRRPSSRRSTGW